MVGSAVSPTPRPAVTRMALKDIQAAPRQDQHYFLFGSDRQMGRHAVLKDIAHASRSDVVRLSKFGDDTEDKFGTDQWTDLESALGYTPPPSVRELVVACTPPGRAHNYPHWRSLCCAVQSHDRNVVNAKQQAIRLKSCASYVVVVLQLSASRD